MYQVQSVPLNKPITTVLIRLRLPEDTFLLDGAQKGTLYIPEAHL